MSGDTERNPLPCLPVTSLAAKSTMVAGTGFADRASRLGLGEPLALRGGDAHALVRSVELGFEWQADLRDVIEAAFARAANEASWFRLEPLLLLGEPGVGRTHVARRVSHVAGIPHVVVDLTDSSGMEQLWPRSCGPDLFLPSLPVLAMAVGGCANPIVSVIGIERLDANSQQRLAAMIHPETASRWIDYATSSTVDLRQISWMVQCTDRSAVVQSLSCLLRPLGLVWPDPHHLAVHQAEILAEAAIDVGVIDRVQGRAAEGLRALADVRGRSTADIYDRASRWLETAFN